MALEQTVNSASLAIVNSELSDSLERIKQLYEELMSSPYAEGWARCEDELRQVAGCLKMIPLEGARQLCDELIETVRLVAEGDSREPLVVAVNRGMLILTNYVTSICESGCETSLALVPWINELRAVRRAPFVLEADFSPTPIPTLPPVAVQQTTQGELPAERMKMVHRMYQTGLLGVMQSRPQKLHFHLMHRALMHIHPTVSGHLRQIVILAAATAEHLEHEALTLNITRRRVLAEVDKLLRAMVKGVDNPLQAITPATGRELLFLCALGQDQRDLNCISELECPLPMLGFGDEQIQYYTSLICTSGLDAMAQVSRELQIEIGKAKDILEIASEHGSLLNSDHKLLETTITRIADTLRALGLQELQVPLSEQISILHSWLGAAELDRAALIKLADTLLYVESRLMEHQQRFSRDSQSLTPIERNHLVAESALAEAKQIVITESSSRVNLAKRSVEAYLQSNFDIGNIANLADTLDSIRGAADLLNLSQVASVLQRIVALINEGVLKGNSGSYPREQRVMMVADTLASLEYYFDALNHAGNTDTVMALANESLELLQKAQLSQ